MIKRKNEEKIFEIEQTLEFNFLEEINHIAMLEEINDVAASVQAVKMNHLSSPRTVALLANRDIPDALIAEKLGVSPGWRWMLVNRFLSSYRGNKKRWK